MLVILKNGSMKKRQIKKKTILNYMFEGGGINLFFLGFFKLKFKNNNNKF